MKIVLKKSQKPSSPPTWRFLLVADNGEIVATSEGYKRKVDATKTIALIQSDAASALVVEEE